MLRQYLLPQLLPPIPATFGHQNLYPSRGWGMLKNAGPGAIGDCTVAGAMHVEMVWNAVVNKLARFTPLDAQDDYFAITGGHDDGADMVTVAKYWQNTGFRDSQANRHKILAYLHVDPANLEHIDAACYLFDAVGLGIEVGNGEMEAFNRYQPWNDPNWPVNGYHFIPMVGKDANYRKAVSWGGLVDLGQEWFKAKVGEVVAVLSDENLIAGKSLEGFDLDALEADLEAIAA